MRRIATTLMATCLLFFVACSDEGDVVIDPVAGSATTLRAAKELNRNAYGFEVSKDFYKKAQEKMLIDKIEPQISLFEGEKI